MKHPNLDERFVTIADTATAEEGTLNPASVIDRLTIQAYLETHYHVHGDPGFTLRVGQASPELHSAHERSRVECSAFVTASNPFSRPASPAANAARQAELDHALRVLGQRFDQNAIVWSGLDAVPRLILLR